MAIQLGATGRDVITGYIGIVMGKAQYLTGCNQVLLIPRTLDKDGKRREGEWFDEQRIEVATDEVIILHNGETPGADLEAPKR